MKFIATSCEFSLHEDDWIEGEGNLIARWNEELAEAETITELMENVPYLDKSYGRCSRIQDEFENDPGCEGDYHRFDADLMVDIEPDCHSGGGFRIIKPTEEKWKKFENGKVKLYALHITVYIKKFSDLDVDDVCNEGWRH